MKNRRYFFSSIFSFTFSSFFISAAGFWHDLLDLGGFPVGSDSKESTCNAGDLGSIPRFGRSPGRRGTLATHSSILALTPKWHLIWDTINKPKDLAKRNYLPLTKWTGKLSVDCNILWWFRWLIVFFDDNFEASILYLWLQSLSLF